MRRPFVGRECGAQIENAAGRLAVFAVAPKLANGVRRGSISLSSKRGSWSGRKTREMMTGDKELASTNTVLMPPSTTINSQSNNYKHTLGKAHSA